jgi:hypothetical protein
MIEPVRYVGKLSIRKNSARIESQKESSRNFRCFVPDNNADGKASKKTSNNTIPLTVYSRKALNKNLCGTRFSQSMHPKNIPRKRILL